MTASLLRKKPNWLLIAAAVVAALHVAVVGIFVIQRWSTLDFLRLHYTVELGVDWIDQWWNIFLFPAIAISTLLMNSALVVLLWRKHQVYGQMLSVATLMLEVGYFAAVIFALLLNV